MDIDIRGLDNEATLSQIAKLAYGSGATEKTSGGKGNLGILDGRVVKFNTHWRERGGRASEAMRASCDALRLKLSEIATALLAARPGADAATNARLARALANVRAKLGLNPDGAAVATTNLLDRKAVASVLNAIRRATGFDAWGELRAGDPAAFSSRTVSTAFERVRLGVCLDTAVRDAAAALAHPADGLPGATLGAEATEFLVGVVRRDIAEKRAAGKPLPTLDEVVQGIRDFTSPCLNVTLQVFNLDAISLRHRRPTLERMASASPYLSGSPAAQRADRADVAVSFLSDMAPDNRGFEMTVVMSLVAEKIPEMRRLQPEGRLTGATVWQACFGEEAPEAVARQWGTSGYFEAFLDRLDKIVTPLCRRYGSPEVSRDLDVHTIDSIISPLAGTGMAFTPMMRQALKVPGFVQDFARDYVATPPLYAVADAESKTDDDLREQLEKDISRQCPVFTFRDGNRQEVVDFRRFLGDVAGANDAVAGFMAQADAFFRAGERDAEGRPTGITPIQRKVMFLGLTQAALLPFIALMGVGGEHEQAQFEVSRDGDAIVITYGTMPECPIEARYSYRIEPDGSNVRTGEFFSRPRPPAAAQ